MPENESSGPKGDAHGQGQTNHEEDACFQTRKTVSNCIKDATSVFQKQLFDYWLMVAEIDLKFNQIATSSEADRRNLRVLIDLQVRTMVAANKIEETLKTLVRLSHFFQ